MNKTLVIILSGLLASSSFASISGIQLAKAQLKYDATSQSRVTGKNTDLQKSTTSSFFKTKKGNKVVRDTVITGTYKGKQVNLDQLTTTKMKKGKGGVRTRSTTGTVTGTIGDKQISKKINRVRASTKVR